MIGAVATGVALVLAAPCMVVAQETQAERTEFASQAMGLTMAYFEAQRSGPQTADAAALYPSVWEWKEPTFTDMCSEAVLNITGSTTNPLGTYGGFFEAGNAVTATGTMAFTAVQRMMGAIEFAPFLEANTPTTAAGDPAGCITGAHSTNTLATNYMREARFMGKSLAATVISTEPGDFAMLVGVGDTSTYRDDAPLPSWLAPVGDQQKCYVADEDNPAADIAGQLAAGLAMSAKYASDFGNAEDMALATEWEALAIQALQYADRMVGDFTVAGSTCTESPAVSNCIGATCTEIDPDDGSETRGTCSLYPNGKPATEQMFVANAALWYATGDVAFRDAADAWYFESEEFNPNWNNVLPQGIMIMAAAPDSPGAVNSKAFYQEKLAARTQQWAECSNDGVGEYGDGKDYCLRTPDGSAYPLDMPWGNLGAITNGLCMAAVTEKYNLDPANSERNRCFMHRQLGYLFNHKCANCTEIDDSNDTSDFINDSCSACATSTPAGFSYMVGYGPNYPTRLHSRDAAYPNFDEEYLPDGNLLCGAVVSGPYAHGGSGTTGRTEVGTDLYTNNRDLWYEAEPALDYSAGMICALAGYASLEGPITNCEVRGPLTRGLLSGVGFPALVTPESAEAPGPIATFLDTLPAAEVPDDEQVAPVAAPAVLPNTTAALPLASAETGCGAEGEPACAGADLDDREFECDYGFEAEDGICVPFTPPTEVEKAEAPLSVVAPPQDETTTTVGSFLDATEEDEEDEDEEDDTLAVATPVPTPVGTPVPTPVGTPVPTPVPTPVATPTGGVTPGCGHGGQPACAGDDLADREFECDYGFESFDGICGPWTPHAERPPPPPEMQTACGKGGEPVCTDTMLYGREFECDFGYIGDGGICIPYEEFEAKNAAKRRAR